MAFKYALFDFDGTVVNSIPCIIKSVRETFEHFGFPEPPECEIRRYIGVPLKKYFPYLAQEHYEKHDPEAVMSFYRNLYKEYSPTHVTLYEGMHQVLEDLREQGIKTGIVSSKETAPIEENCRQLGILGLFDGIVGVNQVRLCKPLPETVFLCAQKIGVEDIREALVLGDSPKDIEMGRRAGAPTCAVPWGAGTVEELKEQSPDYFAETVDEMHNIILQREVTLKTVNAS